jgi:hypothetical protein
MVSRRAVRSLPLGPRVLDPFVLGVDLLLSSHHQCAAEELVVDHISRLNPGLGYPVESLGAELATCFRADPLAGRVAPRQAPIGDPTLL